MLDILVWVVFGVAVIVGGAFVSAVVFSFRPLARLLDSFFTFTDTKR